MELIAIFTLAVATPLHAADAPVTFSIRKGGDVTWKSGACTADVWLLRARSEELIKSAEDADRALELPLGKYEAVVGCPSEEGMVKRRVAFVVKGGPLTVPVVLEPGFLLVKVLRFDTPVRAEIVVYDERGREVASSKEKAIIPVPAGRLRVVARVKDDGPRPVLGNAAATVVAKQKVEVTVDTTDGELTVTLLENGKKAGGVVALRAPGQATRLVELRAGEKGSVPPGTYDLVTQLDDTHDFAEVVTRGIVIVPGKAGVRSVAHRTGMLAPVVLVDGKKPPEGAKIEVELFAPGAATSFHTIAPGVIARLAPGPLEVVARRTDVTLDDGTNATVRQKVTVAAGSKKAVTLDLSSGRLDVQTFLGGKVRALDVEVVIPGGDAPVAKKTADPDGKVSFALGPGRYVVRGVLRSPQGDIAAEQTVTVKKGARALTKVDLIVGTAVVQVFRSGIAVPAEVRFFDVKKTRVEDGRPVGAPTLAVPAGQEAVLPPGIYALWIMRKGTERNYSELKIAAGRTVERTVEIKEPAGP